MRLPQPARCATCAGSTLGESPGPNCYTICTRVPTLPTLVSRSIIGAAGRETPDHERGRRACARTRSLARITYSGELAHCLSMIVPATAPAASSRGLASEPESEPIAPPPVDASLRTRAVRLPAQTVCSMYSTQHAACAWSTSQAPGGPLLYVTHRVRRELCSTLSNPRILLLDMSMHAYRRIRTSGPKAEVKTGTACRPTPRLRPQAIMQHGAQIVGAPFQVLIGTLSGSWKNSEVSSTSEPGGFACHS